MSLATEQFLANNSEVIGTLVEGRQISELAVQNDTLMISLLHNICRKVWILFVMHRDGNAIDDQYLQIMNWPITVVALI